MARTYAARDENTQTVHYISKSFSYLDPTAVAIVIGKVPAGSQILNIVSGVYVQTAFTSGTNHQLDIGTTADDDLYATNLELNAKGFVAIDEVGSATGINGWYVSADTTFTMTPDHTGTTDTAGVATVVIAYIPQVG